MIDPSSSARDGVVTLHTDLKMLDHKPHAGHPDRPERLAAVLRHLDRTGQRGRCDQRGVRTATDSELLRVHSPEHIEAMGLFAARGGGQVEVDTWLSSGSEQAARLAAGCVIDAVEAVVRGGATRSLCLVRPPGHHARPDDPMGFCLYGSVAVGAADAIERLGLNRVLVVDWDVHHGNGTQEIFYDNDKVGFFSIHRHPFYPGTGLRDETGTGKGLGMTKNIPIGFATPRSEYLAAFETSLGRFADQLKPELILISAGFDGHAEDPVGNLGLEVEDFTQMTRFVMQVAETHGQGRLVSVLEGGYNIPILAGCVSAHLESLGVKPNEI